MKSRSTDLLLIVVALIAILSCGFGLGKRFSPKAIEIDPTPPSVAIENFQEVTLSNLSEDLALTPEQEAAILSDIQSTTDEIVATRRKALFEYHLQILRLHDKISGKLEPQQREKLEKSRKSLQDLIEKSFPILLDQSGVSVGGESQRSK